MSSREKRAEIVALMFHHATDNDEDYLSYMTACLVAWHFRDSSSGMSTIDQVKLFNYVHMFIAGLASNLDDPDAFPHLHEAHNVMHELQELLIDKLKAKGIISADDHGFTDDSDLLSKHESDFSAWSEELNFGTNNEGK